MRKFVIQLLLIVLFGTILVCPVITLQGAATGLLLWYQVVLPTLFPFLILTNLLLKSQAFECIGNTLGVLIGKCFRTSKSGSFAVIVGFLCGYPLGAKVIADLHCKGLISQQEAQYLLSFCNNSSPMFIVSFFVYQILQDSQYLFVTLLSLYAAPIILSFFTYRYYMHSTVPYTYNTKQCAALAETPAVPKLRIMELLDSSIMDGVYIITKIGGYIMLFSIVIQLFLAWKGLPYTISQYLLPLLEVTSGLRLFQSISDSTLRYLCMIFLVSFGGFCAVAQTQCVLYQSPLRIVPYLIQKIITAIIAVIISSFLIYIL